MFPVFLLRLFLRLLRAANSSRFLVFLQLKEAVTLLFCIFLQVCKKFFQHLLTDTQLHSLFHSDESYVHPFISPSLNRSAHRQAAAYHSPRPVQSDTRGGQRGPAEVPGIRGPHPLHQLAEGWCQSFREGSPHVPAGTREPADQKHQGKGWGWYTAMVIITFFFFPAVNRFVTPP